MKKLLFINSDLFSGGAEKAMSIVATELAKDGYDVYMVLLRKNPIVYRVSTEVKLIQFDNSANTKLGKLLARIKNIRKNIKDIEPDTVVAFTYRNNIVLAMATMGLNVKTIISERLHPLYKANCEKFRPWELKIIKMLYSRCDYIVYQTKEAMDSFSVFKDNPKRVIIPNAVTPQSVRWKREEAEKKVIAGGRFTAQKNFSLLIRSFAAFHKSHLDYELYIYGDGPLRGELQNQITELGLNNSIFLPGHNDNFIEAMRKGYMYISSSNFEGISNCMLEALSIGMPVICTDCPVGGASLMIRNMQNGVLIKPDDLNQLTEAMCRLADDDQLCDLFSENAFEACRNYTPELIIKMWKNIL